MKKKLLYAVIALLLSSAVNFACSNNKEAESEKGTAQEVTEKAAKEMVDRIRGPIEKARAAKELQEQKYRDIEEALKETGKE
ncbi:MAG TPA: hypothetical protein ENH01_04970 [Nitrospirae bacterium]|nr:hypothetical protein [Nitrospirota bacterium]